MQNEYPTILERVKSTLIDSVIIIALIILISEILNSFENVPDWIRTFLFFLVFLYEPIMICLGGTLGNNKIGIRVRSNSNHSKKINIFQSLVRYFFKVMLGWVSLLLIILKAFMDITDDPKKGLLQVDIEIAE